MKNRFKRSKTGQRMDVFEVLRIVTILVVFAGFGLLFLLKSHAAFFYVSTEAENGAITTATRITDATASGGATVKFGSSTGGSSAAKPVLVGSMLQKGDTGTRLKMDGVAVWGVQDQITAEVGVEQYTNRQKVVSTIKAWGGNHVRLRLLASDYDSQAYMTKAQEIQQIKDWRDTVVAAGLYFMPTWWDSLDGSYQNAGWASKYSQAFPMMTDVVNALGNDPMVFYEPFNEPNNVSTGEWLPAMKATVAHYRNTLHYTGILLIDMTVWSHHYDDSGMTQLEQYDASLTGMGGKHQIIFAKHDYANEYSDVNNWTASSWAANGDGWDFSKHATWESEFGNYNGSSSTVHLSWSQSAANGLAGKINDGTIVGASAFVFNWVDANTMVGSDNTTPNTWGGYVKDFLTAVN
jgi:hypothetical protein